MDDDRRIPPAITIAGTFLLVSVLWILLSDRVVEWVAPDAEQAAWLQTAKGLGFVIATTLLIYVMANRYLARAERTANQLREAYDQTLAGWASALDIRDHSTGEHTERVTELTVALAERFEISGDDLDDIRRGATLHDIGKIGVPDRILGKLGPLDDDEWAAIKEHPDIAARMLGGIGFLAPAMAIPWCHHEKWDGTGYPRGLAGDDIPFPARMFAVVDVYDAITSERPYREPTTSDEALAHIQAGSGTHFDPTVVEVFVAMMHERQAAGLSDEGGRL